VDIDLGHVDGRIAASMFWYSLLAVLAILFLLSVSLPVPRRVWALGIYSSKYFWLWVSDAIRLRKLFMTLTGRRARWQRLTRPMLLRMWCEDMGPTFIKFGQIIASSAGMFPDAYVLEFQKVLDRVKPFGFSDVKRTLDEELGAEKAAHLVKVDPEQLASASIAQVHTAELRDGTPVVIKVQRPGIIPRCMADMKLMRMLARIVQRFKKNVELANPVGVIDDFTKTLTEELDFRKEAENLDRFNEIMRELGHKNIRAPVPHHEYTTRKVLVMERFSGLRVDRFEEIRARGIDGETKLVDGLRGWFQCVVFYGFFHGDVHAGNLMLLDDDTIGFLDFGIVGRFDDKARYLVTDYMIAFATGNYRRLAEIICEMGGTPPGLDMDGFVADLAETYKPLLTLSFGEVNYAEFLPGIQRTATRHQMRMPNEFILITKQLLYFDRYAKALAPKLNVFTDPRLVLGMMSDIQKARAQVEAKQQKPA
jgi:predicted unusual protein kinase regulating ubiquinone biosynthesis (AarF/ABC1/UbiB family)